MTRIVKWAWFPSEHLPSTPHYSEQIKYFLELVAIVCHPLVLHSNLSLTLSQSMSCFYVSVIQVFSKLCGKGEIARNEQFLRFPQCFLPF